jgi:hypothetical protein
VQADSFFARAGYEVLDVAFASRADGEWKVSIPEHVFAGTNMSERNMRKMFIEPLTDGDPFEVADAHTALGYVAPVPTRADRVAVVTRMGRAFDAQPKRSLHDAAGKPVKLDSPVRIRGGGVGAVCAAGTLPQIFINGYRMGGFCERKEHLSADGGDPSAGHPLARSERS